MMSTSRAEGLVLREAERGTKLWEQARDFADARPLDYILVHADLNEPQAVRARGICAFRGEKLVAVGSEFRPHRGRMFSVAGEDQEALGALAQSLVSGTDGRYAMLCREADALSVRRATGLAAGDHEIHMILDGPAKGGAPERAIRTDERTWDQVVEFYNRLPREVFFSEVYRDNPSYYVEQDGKVVAAAISHFVTPRVLQVGGVLTDPEYRRRGLAGSIVAALANEAHEAGRLASLFVRSDNEGAIALYEKLGFRRHQVIALMIGPGQA